MRLLALACLVACTVAVTKLLPLLVDIGNPLLEDQSSVWTGFPDDSDLWTVITNDNVTLTVSDGNLYVEPIEGRGGIARVSMDTRDHPFSLENSSLYFYMLPMLKHEYQDANDDWDITTTLYDFDTGFSLIYVEIDGDGNDPSGTVDVSADGDTTSDFDQFAYNPSTHRWWRFRHDGHDVIIESSPSCGTWTERLRAVNFDGPLNNLTLEWAISLDAPESPPETLGYFSDFNPEPTPRSLPLLVTIGTPKVTQLTVELPLLVEIGDVS